MLNINIVSLSLSFGGMKIMLAWSISFDDLVKEDIEYNYTSTKLDRYSEDKKMVYCKKK